MFSFEQNNRANGLRSESETPEILAARRFFTPATHEAIAQLAENLEATIGGGEPTIPRRKSRKRRGLSLLVGVPVTALLVLFVVAAGGWVSAVQYHDVAEQQELLRKVVTAQIQLAGELRRSQRYQESLMLLEIFDAIVVALDEGDGELVKQLEEERVTTIVWLVAESYGHSVDLLGVEWELRALTAPSPEPMDD